MPNLTNVAFFDIVNFQGFHGRLSQPQNIVDDFARIGATGSSSQNIGVRSRKESIDAWAGASSETEAEKIADDAEDLQGLVVEAQDDFGRKFPRVRIYSISATIRAGRGPLLPTGVQMTHKIDIRAVVEVLP